MGKALTTALSKLLKNYGGSIRDPTTAAIIKRLFLSSPQLNFLFGGGWIIGRIMQLHGPESSGKSTLATYIAKEVQKQKDHNVVVYVDFERTFEMTFAKRLGLDLSPEKFIFLQPEHGEEAFTILEDLIRTNEIGLIIWDSDATTGSKAQMLDEYGKACVSPDTEIEFRFEA